MKVSLNWVKKYVQLPEDLTNEQLAYDLTMRTVEVENVESSADKFKNIVVGVIRSVEAHPDADRLRVCMVDVGDGEDKQIVCGGSNLYEGEKVVVSKPGAMVYWHGEGEPVAIKETKMRGVKSYGMICGATEVYLEDYYPPADEREIVDLGDTDCYPGENIAEVIGMDDTILEIDNKSLTNRPDLWGHYGIARELAAIYKVPLKPLSQEKPDPSLPGFRIDIQAPEKCRRFAAIVIDGVDSRPSPNWMKTAVTNGGMRPINALVDITNYIMMAVGQPTHGYDFTHIKDHIIVREAKPGEKLILLDQSDLDLTESDLVICDVEEPVGLAGIRGGRKDSILPDTKKIILELANFSAETIRKTGKRFDQKTDASIRYEKGIDTQRIDQGISLAMELFREIFPDSKILAYGDEYPEKTEQSVIQVDRGLLDRRLGKVFPDAEIEDTLTRLGYDVQWNEKGFLATAPTWRSTGDVSMWDDVMGDLARIWSFESFEATPLPVNFENAVHQPVQDLDRKLREHLAFRCGFNEIFTYPWVEEKYIDAAGIDKTDAVRLATPPAPDMVNLRQSLVPGMLESVMKNLRYFEDFKLFEMAQVYHKGEYHESTEEETLPVQKLTLCGAVVGKDGKKDFFDAKGAVESLARYCQMEPLTLKQVEKPSWADEKVYLNILLGKKVIGALGLVSVQAMNAAGIKRTNMAVFELDETALEPLASRDNKFEHLPLYPEVDEDLSILVDEGIKWADIAEAIKHQCKNLRFVEEYRGQQVPEGKKSVTLSLTIGSDKGTMDSKAIDKRMNKIIKTLENKVGAELREG
ncbi:phenylalanine--tRNA ligase subunit beta [Mobilibacterium timonense]|uniref:phenylalanine--tRNA ligase subunit beta n=1 Tax=Mobilibacterium timonense TaxID=1871012 RepID=UPI003A8F4CB2